MSQRANGHIASNSTVPADCHRGVVPSHDLAIRHEIGSFSHLDIAHPSDWEEQLNAIMDVAEPFQALDAIAPVPFACVPDQPKGGFLEHS
jgi:hypothetical protein